ncbi:MAG: hypothetical protein FWC90_07780, partial [Oscillospiraceae bacterium]|nr:hypothetical protein [Oscillospiraceae bacterium]
MATRALVQIFIVLASMGLFFFYLGKRVKSTADGYTVREHPQYDVYTEIIKALQKAGYTIVHEQTKDMRTYTHPRGGTVTYDAGAGHAVVIVQSGAVKCGEVKIGGMRNVRVYAQYNPTQLKAEMFLKKLDEVHDFAARQFVEEHGVDALIVKSEGGG